MAGTAAVIGLLAPNVTVCDVTVLNSNEKQMKNKVLREIRNCECIMWGLCEYSKIYFFYLIYNQIAV